MNVEALRFEQVKREHNRYGPAARFGSCGPAARSMTSKPRPPLANGRQGIQHAGD